MPSVRFSRDKRGYEYVYLMHTPTRRGKPGRSQVLYWYRTPPGVRIGRQPFSDDVQRTLEAQNPGVAFDWPTIISTPMPPPDMTEFWRERRRAAKAARQQSRSQDADEDASEDAEPGEVSVDVADLTATTTTTAEALVDDEAPGGGGSQESTADDAGARKRRRRRGGRRRKVAGESSAQSTAATGSTESSGDRMSLPSTAPTDLENRSDPTE